MRKPYHGRQRAAGTVIMVGIIIAVLILVLGVWSRSGPGAVRGITTNVKRVGYLQSLGWDVETVPVTEQTVHLPEEFPDVLKQYNELQKQQNFDLEKYSGRDITLYTYRVLNYPGNDEVQCSLYLFRGRVIGGDIHSTSFTGFMCGIR